MREPAAVFESEDVLDHAHVHSWLGHWLSGKSREAKAPAVVHTQRQHRPVDRSATALGGLQNSAGHVTETVGHVPEFAGHDAETGGHDGPKYAGLLSGQGGPTVDGHGA